MCIHSNFTAFALCQSRHAHKKAWVSMDKGKTIVLIDASRLLHLAGLPGSSRLIEQQAFQNKEPRAKVHGRNVNTYGRCLRWTLSTCENGNRQPGNLRAQQAPLSKSVRADFSPPPQVPTSMPASKAATEGGVKPQRFCCWEQ